MRLLALAALLLAACASPKPGDPPRVEFGRHECARCGMIVSEARFAAGYVDDSGETVAYDDLGELLADAAERPELKARAWVGDFNGRGWLKLGEAHVTRFAGFATPMGTGWLAFRSPAEADVFARARSGK